MVSPGEAEGHSGDPQIRRITLVILLKGRVDPRRGGGLFWGSSWRRRVIVVLLVGVWAPAPCYCW